MQVHALIPAAGRGARYGTAENKIFATLNGRAVVARTAEAFLQCASVDTVTIVGRADELERLQGLVTGTEYDSKLSFCAGGASRQESVHLGLESLAARGAHSSDVVLVHDAARPLVSQELIERCIGAATLHGTAVAAIPLVDTIKRVSSNTGLIEQTISREDLWAAQTPQAASLGVLRQAIADALSLEFSGTDEASALEKAGVKPFVVVGERSNIKITTQDDLAFASALIDPQSSSNIVQPARPPFRIGMGYDIHQLVPGRRLVLGGVEIAYSHGLLGHSDADVILHAICDALLGAAALPDIGHLFPNDDPNYAGADSLELLRAVHGKITEAGYVVGNVDVCVIAELPKISPHAPEMRRRIADALQASIDAVSIKATTNEKIGSLGAGKGIACHATALIMRME